MAEDLFDQGERYGLPDGMMKRYESRTKSIFPGPVSELDEQLDRYEKRGAEAADAAADVLEDIAVSLDGGVRGLQVDTADEGMDWIRYDVEVLYDPEETTSHETEVVAGTYTKDDETFREDGFDAEIEAFNEAVEDAVEGRQVVDMEFVTMSWGGDPNNINVETLGRSFQAWIVYEGGRHG